ncbi:zinc-binding alcohol dehydrogenase [Paenibacillus mesophilus]|uniref:zinc-dependent alcohol dehydrogenase n=1 Tax=Paenibacillus mesophilus TaxID=2582849 RepID=UPI00110F43D0|nr:zinc-binding alcohol dehydrogenase [Paenibacillus mesophilus]TMV48945.1 zinc-binding alcohol dehydrogenase [Paenibacillus mesophilus]
MKAHAVVFTDKGQVEYKEVEVPEPGDNDVVVDVEYSWISTGTESSYLRAERIKGEVPYKEGDPWPFPIVPGYQKVGIVRAVGAAVRGIEAGERVFAALGKVSGMFEPMGGHVSPAITPAHQIWKLPADAQPLDYCGLVLAQVGYNCGIRPAVEAGDRAVVIGDGLVGQWAAQTLLHRGAQVAVLGRHDGRLGHLPEQIRGANTRRTELAEFLGNYGSIAVVIDSVGDMDAFRTIQPYMKRDSHFVSAGFLGETGLIDIQTLRGQEITLHTPSGWTGKRMEETIKAISEGWLQTSPLISHHFRVEDAAEAWQTIQHNKAGCLGVVLSWR